ANAAMDSLARHRRGLGLPALTINWGAWAGAGMVAALNEPARRRMQANGVAPIPVETACRLLDYALVDPMPQRVMIDIDWAVFNPAFSGAASASFWAAASPVLTAAPPVPPKVSIAEHIAGLNNEDAYRFVTAQIAEVVKQVLYIPTDKALDNYQGFFDMGLDSITVAELRVGLQRQLGCSLPQTLLFDYPNIHEVGTYWLQQYAGLQDSEDGVITAPIDASTIQQYSEQELDRLISEKLEML
ncbi:MAG: KR domain-containing protein, partial [Methylovulum sp.]